MDAAEQLEPLCYGGEELLESATVTGGAIGITSHRVLVLKPEAAGARFHAPDRPNVIGFATKTSGPKGHRNRAIIAGIVGVGLLVVGAALDFGQPADAAPGGGFDGLLGLVMSLLGAIGLFAGALRVLGLLALLAALGFMGWYLWKASWGIEITVAGAEPIRIPISRGQMEVVERFEAYLAEARADDATDWTLTSPG